MDKEPLKNDGKAPEVATNGIRLMELGASDTGDRRPELRRDVTDLSIDQSGCQAFLPSCMQVTFADREVEALYQTYHHKEKQRDLQCFLVVALLFDVFALVLHVCHPSRLRDVTKMCSLAIFSAINLGTLLLCCFQLLPGLVWLALPSLVWLFFNAQVFCDVLLNLLWPKSGDSLPWLLLTTYMTYALLPLRLRYCFLLNLVTVVGHVIVTACITSNRDPVYLELAANILLLLCANILGCLAYFFADKRQRKAFLEARQTLEVKLVIEEQSQEQERLLLSVLPQHVAAEIRQDLGAVVDGQFKKIYMSRHENVSILFADIVGFTAISSTYSAAELVRILNELFARFDKLADKFHQMRIKILGDCYYCISGAPEERRDHAVLCVHMGLSMVEAIKYVQKKTNSPVDMRVGIHTGGILAGVLGQRQWQFDVYSKDVELANKMESGGLPGRVHISEKTLQFLDGEFEIEPGDGSSREEAIKLAGLRTYLIVKVLKMYPEGTLDEHKGAEVGSNHSEGKETPSEEEKEEARMLGNSEPNPATEEDYRRRLYQELVLMGERRNLPETANPLTLCFKKDPLEAEYQCHNAEESGVAIVSAPTVLVFSSLAQMCVLPRNAYSIATFLVGLVILSNMAAISIAPVAFKSFPRFVRRWGQRINGDFLTRHIWVVFVMLALSLTNIIDMFACDDNVVMMEFPLNATVTFDTQNGCLFPQYFSDFAAMVLLSITVLTHISHVIKLVLMVAVTSIHCFLNVDRLNGAFRSSDLLTFNENANEMVPRMYILSGVLVMIAAGLAIINVHTEGTTRQLFLWRQELEEQKERASGMRHKNESLVYNILPPNVAHHFLGSRKRDEELYSQSHSQVGVLFASMPNFTDFYTEESVNNQGLECLRFLNEVISDFDALMEDSRFQDIIKIKTIGSTYMAASGLNTDEKFSPDTPIRVQWAHLACLTEFALALKETLHGINEQSFNNFILRMGINHGPIIAGVIGARKPHFDMWGNTVNVASRMESTGKVGCIQVVEETVNILKEFGYEFEQRGLVSVKGKGKLMTYYLMGKKFHSETNGMPQQNASVQ